VRRDRRAMRSVAHSDAAKIFRVRVEGARARGGGRGTRARANERTNGRTNRDECGGVKL
jgi:hypothetical protein